MTARNATDRETPDERLYNESRCIDGERHARMARIPVVMKGDPSTWSEDPSRQGKINLHGSSGVVTIDEHQIEGCITENHANRW